MNKQKQNHATKYTIIILFIIQLATVAWVATLQGALNVRDYGNERNTTESIQTTSELRFCLDNQIRPCDGSSIEQWNTAHPDNTFKRS